MKLRGILLIAAAMSATTAFTRSRATGQTQPTSGPTTIESAHEATTAPARVIPPALAAAMRNLGATSRPGGSSGTLPPLIPQSGSFRDTYQVVVDRNMFIRTHISRGDSSYDSRRSRDDRSQPRQVLVLTGVVKDGGQYVAFIENTRTGETERHKAGDSLAAGKVAKLDFNTMEYDNGGAQLHIEVGMNLDGRAPEFRSSSSESRYGNNGATASNSGGATTAPSGGAPLNGASSFGGPPSFGASPGGQPPGGQSGDASQAPPSASSGSNDIVERLRQRRLQERQGAGQ